ncbi:MAG: hypothetical protein A3J97_09445 [Spirochaetes bacterium RIFOXYC1_FULL_54_7]|nr:MAG: hypothetical protein A3J97_09445 [Spirochaetes bacterium RIFOXYC1_FULL_54_7]
MVAIRDRRNNGAYNILPYQRGPTRARMIARMKWLTPCASAHTTINFLSARGPAMAGSLQKQLDELHLSIRYPDK